MRRRLESHPRSLQVSPPVTEDDEPNIPSHFPTTDTENDSQILRLSERRAGVPVQGIRPDAQTARNSGFASYQKK